MVYLLIELFCHIDFLVLICSTHQSFYWCVFINEFTIALVSVIMCSAIVVFFALFLCIGLYIYILFPFWFILSSFLICFYFRSSHSFLFLFVFCLRTMYIVVLWKHDFD